MELLPRNLDAAKIFQATRKQVLVAGMGGHVIDINHLAVWAAIDRYRVKSQVECFEKVVGIFNHMLAEQRNEESDK